MCEYLSASRSVRGSEVATFQTTLFAVAKAKNRLQEDEQIKKLEE